MFSDYAVRHLLQIPSFDNFDPSQERYVTKEFWEKAGFEFLKEIGIFKVISEYGGMVEFVYTDKLTKEISDYICMCYDYHNEGIEYEV